jgi:hypothetical protein
MFDGCGRIGEELLCRIDSSQECSLHNIEPTAGYLFSSIGNFLAVNGYTDVLGGQVVLNHLTLIRAAGSVYDFRNFEEI